MSVSCDLNATGHAPGARSSHAGRAPGGWRRSIRELSGVLREIADAIGPDAALRLARLRGGTRLTIPARVAPGCWLAETFGLDKAKALAARFAGEGAARHIDIPLGPTGARASLSKELDRLIGDGLGSEEIARRLGVAARTVRRHKARLRHREG